MFKLKTRGDDSADGTVIVCAFLYDNCKAVTEKVFSKLIKFHEVYTGQLRKPVSFEEVTYRITGTSHNTWFLRKTTNNQEIN